MAFWALGGTVGYYSNRGLRPVETTLLERYRAALGGRVLELGCGAGRVTSHLCKGSDAVFALDIARQMVVECQRVCPEARVFEGDLRDLSRFGSGSLDAVFGTFNVLDMLGDGERGRVLDQIRRILRPDGLLIVSSHNRGYAARLGTPFRLLVGDPRQPLRSLARLPMRLGNRRRMRWLERSETDYAILNDAAHDFAVVHYYISRDSQERQLGGHGFELVQCLDLEGRVVPCGAMAADCPELSYVARRVGPATLDVVVH